MIEHFGYSLLLMMVPLAVSCSPHTSAQEQVQTPPLLEWMQKGRLLEGPKQISLKEFQQAIRNWTITLENPQEPGLSSAWASLGFRYESWSGSSNGSAVLYRLYEEPGKERGWGGYVIFVSPETENILLAPHQYHDRGSGVIASEIAEGAAYRVFAWNNTHRYRAKREGLGFSSDLAHESRSLFSALTLAFAQSRKGKAMIQLHGYGESKRKSVQAREAAMIISPGQRHTPGPFFKRTAACLKSKFPGTLQYPDQVRELGATTNVSGRILNRTEDKEFVHIELSSRTRKQLRNSTDAMAKLVLCLGPPEIESGVWP